MSVSCQMLTRQLSVYNRSKYCSLVWSDNMNQMQGWQRWNLIRRAHAVLSVCHVRSTRQLMLMLMLSKLVVFLRWLTGTGCFKHLFTDVINYIFFSSPTTTCRLCSADALWLNSSVYVTYSVCFDVYFGPLTYVMLVFRIVVALCTVCRFWLRNFWRPRYGMVSNVFHVTSRIFHSVMWLSILQVSSKHVCCIE